MLLSISLMREVFQVNICVPNIFCFIVFQKIITTNREWEGFIPNKVEQGFSFDNQKLATTGRAVVQTF